LELIDLNLCKNNILKRCPEYRCEGQIIVARHFKNNKIYYPCTECMAIYESYQDVLADRPMHYNDSRMLWEDYGVGKFNAFIGADEAEIRAAGIEIKDNKLSFCYVCGGNLKSEWVLAMKNLKDGNLFCKCPSCQTEWENADDLYFRKPSHQHTVHYRDAFLYEIKEAGWYEEYNRYLHCFICNSGWIKVVRHTKSGKLLFKCDSCNHVWDTPPYPPDDDDDDKCCPDRIDPISENYMIPAKNDIEAMRFFHLKMFREW